MLTADKPAWLTSIRKSQVTGLPPEEVEYPEADGQPRAETDTHLEQMVDALMHPFLRLYDPQQERFLLSRAEEAEARRQAEAELAEEIKARRALEEELARLRAQLKD
jgi:hypothetical protein